MDECGHCMMKVAAGAEATRRTVETWPRGRPPGCAGMTATWLRAAGRNQRALQGRRSQVSGRMAEQTCREQMRTRMREKKWERGCNKVGRAEEGVLNEDKGRGRIWTSFCTGPGN